MYENQDEVCSQSYPLIKGVGSSNSLSRDECQKKCDSNKECKYAALDSEGQCTLYNFCHPRQLIKNSKTLRIVFEKGLLCF